MRTATLWSFLVPIDKVVERARSIRPDLLIVSRVRDADHARHLYAIGATDAVLLAAGAWFVPGGACGKRF